MKDEGLAVCLASSYFGHYAHAGFLSEFDRAGVIPGRLSGASAGALAGGLWAGGLRGEALKDELLKPRFRRSFIDPSATFRLPGVATWSYASGILGGGMLKRQLRRLVGDRRIEDLHEPPLEIAVANLSRGRGEIRSHGPLVEFMLASLSMPLVFRVREIDGERFLDGGVSNEAPFHHWLELPEVERIVVHRISHGDTGPTGGIMNAPWVLANCHGVMNADLEVYRARAVAASGKAVEVLETEHHHPGILHGRRKAEAMFEAGSATARRWLEGRASATGE